MKIASVIPGLQPTLPVAASVVDDVLPPVSVAPSSAGASSLVPSSPLEDSMEEVSMTFAEQVERKSKALNQRKVVAQPGSRAMQHIERIEKLDELMKLLEHPQHAQLETLNQKMQTLLQRSPSPHLDELLEAAGHDPVRCDVVLRHTLAQAQQAQQAQNSALTTSAVQSLELLHKEKGAEVSAGLNTANAIASFTTDPTQKQAMRQLYYQTIVHLQSGNAMLDALLNSFGSVHFHQGLRTLQRALSDDLAARSASIPRRALQKILASLQDAGNISQTLTASNILLKRLSGKLPDINFSPLELTRRLLNLSGNGAYLRDLQNLSRDVAGEQPHHQVLFLSGLVPLVYHLPLGLWRDDKSKNRQMALNLLRTVIGEYAAHEPRATLSQPRAAL